MKYNKIADINTTDNKWFVNVKVVSIQILFFLLGNPDSPIHSYPVF